MGMKSFTRLFGDADAVGQDAGVVVAQTQEGMGGHLDDLFRRLRRNLFDVDAAFAGGHHHHAPVGTVQHCAQVDFLGDVGRRVHQHFAYLEALDEHAQDGIGVPFGVFQASGHLDAAGLAATADQHLGLDHHGRTQAYGDVAHLSWGGRHFALGHRDAVLGEDTFGLIFVQIQR